MVQPEILLSQLQVYSGRPGVTNILDAWHAYFDAHGVPYMALLDRLAYHASLRGVSMSAIWTGSITVPSQTLITTSPGFAYDISNVASLWQDAAGTIPVTVVGDPVGRVDDASSRGNHATQATAAARPTYQIDANGHGYLLFDGVDDFLVTPAIDLSGAPAAFALGAIVREGALQSDVLLEQSPLFTGASGAILLNMTNTSLRANVTGVSPNATTAIDLTTGVANVYSAVFDYAGATLETSIPRYRRNRADLTSTLTYAGTAVPNSVGLNAEFYIAARAGSGSFFNGRFYGAVVRGGSVPLNTHVALEDYYAERTLP